MSRAKKTTQFDDLSQDQKEVVLVWGQGLAVLAGAGSGKTTTLTIKCERLLEMNPDARFCAVSFTEKSASDLKLKLETRLAQRERKLRGEGGVLSGHWVMTIHGLCGAIIREFPAEAGIDGFEPILSETQAHLLWERSLEKLWREDLSPEIREEMDLLLGRMKRKGLHELLSRVKALRNQGALAALLSCDPEDPEFRDSLALGRVAERVLHYYESLKSRRGALDFDDLERLAARVLENDQARGILQSRFDFLMVDEFQDTSPLQGQIVWSLARPDQSNLCVIGDPKQSIYRFRDADVSVFEEFCARLSKQLTLKENYRSRPEIIHFTNRVCDPLFRVSQLQYEPLEPRRDSGDPQQTGVRVLRLRDPKDLASWLKEERDQRGIGLEKFVVLLRKVRSPGAARWLDALSHQGIPLAIGSGGRFWDDPRVAEVIHFLKWWNNPANRLSAAVFLRAPWVSERSEITLEELDLWFQEGIETPLLERFLNAPTNRFAQTLRSLRESDQGLTPGELILSLIIDEGVEQEMGVTLLALWHRAQQLSHEGLSFHETVEELTRGLEASPRETEVPPPQAAGQLRVLTIHASKGLEFEQVLLLDFPAKAERAQSAPNLYWDRKRGVYLPPALPPGVSKKVTAKDPEWEWKQAELSASLAEVKRVFYVALTRAQERLVCVFVGEEDQKQEDESSAPFDPVEDAEYGKDFWRSWVRSISEREDSGVLTAEVSMALTPDRAQWPSETPFVSHRSPPELRSTALYRPRHSVTEWMNLLKCPRKYEWTTLRPREPDSLADGFEGDFSGEAKAGGLSSSEIGTRVHRGLELRSPELLLEVEAAVGEDRFRAEPVLHWMNHSAVMAHDRSRTWKELPFELKVTESELLVGTLDRLIRIDSAEEWSIFEEELRESGVNSLESFAPRAFPFYWIQDFKILRRAKSPEEVLKSYRSQLLLYAWALGKVEPSAVGHCGVSLVVMTPQKGVQWVLCDLPSPEDLEAWVMNIVDRSRQVIDSFGAPSPGAECRYCPFRKQCDSAE